MAPCPTRSCTIRGILPAARTVVLCTIPRASWRIVAVLTVTVALTDIGIRPCPALGGAPTGKSCVPAGSVPVPFTITGMRLSGRPLSVRFHSGPPTSISAPPWLTQVCNAISWLLSRLLVVKLSSTIRSKFFSTTIVSGMVLAFNVSTIIEPPWLGSATL